MTEKCKNPWKENCDSEDIILYIQRIKKHKDKTEEENLPICRECWSKIADSKKEWGTLTTPNNTEGNLVAE